ncbi:MAG: class I SAM-dependent rRNA methyltransferase [Chloroflexi bacterium]|nr:class I SAM-dependent rRNA methyltransferase [Chloroflexota bacterium]
MPKRERSVLRRHPWIFSGAIKAVHGDPAVGETVDVLDSAGAFLACGAYSPHSQIAVRIWTWDESQVIGPDFFRSRLARSFAARSQAPMSTCPSQHAGACSAVRLVNAESDGLPGLIVDRYGDFLVCQFLTAGAERWKHIIVESLTAEYSFAVRGVYERSDIDVRAKEGLSAVTGVLCGEEPPALIEIDEYGARFLVDVKRWHKTGFYLDQRENRRIVGELARGRSVLNAFAYTGGFAVTALRGEAANVTNVESSSPALELARRNAALNGFDESLCVNVEADVFADLRKFRDAGRSFDLIVLDPPRFAQSARQVEKASRAYKDINLLAFKLLSPGGLLVTFSCSGAVSADLFQKIVFGAALDSGREAQIVGRLTQAPDHPVLLSFPEGEYLKGLVLLSAPPRFLAAISNPSRSLQ